MDKEELFERLQVSLDDRNVHKRYALEGSIVSSYMKGHTNTYIDFGFWIGMLTKYVIESYGNDIKVYAFDAVKEFIEFGLTTHLKDHNHLITARNAAILPSTMEKNVSTINVKVTETSSSSIFGRGKYKSYPDEQLYMVEALDQLTKEVVDNSYLKIDLEGVDIEATKELLAIYSPMFLEFEVWYPQELEKVLPVAGNYKTKCPEFNGTNEYYSVIFVRKDIDKDPGYFVFTDGTEWIS